MTLKEIKEHYIVYKREGGYHLHSKEIGDSRQVHKYICTLTKDGRFFRLGDKIPTAKISVLLEQIKEYLELLPYDSEYYCPSYRKGFAQECFIIDRLSDYGFKRDRYSSNVYKLVDKNIYGFNSNGIELFDKVDPENEVVTISISTGDYSWINVKCGFDFEEIHSTIDSLLKPLLLTEGVKNIKLSEKMEMGDVDYVIKELQDLDIVEGKLDLKAKLLELANTL